MDLRIDKIRRLLKKNSFVYLIDQVKEIKEELKSPTQNSDTKSKIKKIVTYLKKFELISDFLITYQK